LPKHRLLNPFHSSTRTHLCPLLIVTHLFIILSIFSTSPQEHQNIISPTGSIDFHCKRIECSYSSKRIISSKTRHRNINNKRNNKKLKKTKKEVNQMEFNPIEKTARNDAYPTCKVISRLQESLKDIRSEMRMEYNDQKRNMEAQK